MLAPLKFHARDNLPAPACPEDCARDRATLHGWASYVDWLDNDALQSIIMYTDPYAC